MSEPELEPVVTRGALQAAALRAAPTAALVLLALGLRGRLSGADVVAALAGGVIAGALTLVERAGRSRARGLRGRALAAAVIGLGGAVGGLAAGLQGAFTVSVLEGRSLEAGYRAVDRMARGLSENVPLVAVAVGLGLASVAWARQCHAGLRRQAASVLLTCGLAPAFLAATAFALDDAAQAVAAWTALGAAPALLLLLALHGLERAEAHLGLAPAAPRALPEGSGRRAWLAAGAVALALALTHGALTLWFAAARERALAALRARGEPLSIADLGPAPPEEDAWPCFEQVPRGFRHVRLWPNAPHWPRGSRRAGVASAVEVALAFADHERAMVRREQFVRRHAPTLALLAEAARRRRCRLSPPELRAEDFAGTPLLEAAFDVALWRGDVEGAVAVIEQRLAHAAALEPELHGLAAYDLEDDALRWLQRLLACATLPAAARARLLERLEQAPSHGTLARVTRGERLRLLEARRGPGTGPAGARLAWVRDRDLVAALEHLTRWGDAWTGTAPFPPRLEAHPTWRPLSARAAEVTAEGPRRQSRLTLARTGAEQALSGP